MGPGMGGAGMGPGMGMNQGPPGHGVGPGGMLGGGPRPPPMRIPNNLPALQRLGQQGQQPQQQPPVGDGQMGVGRGSLVPDNNRLKAAAEAASKLAA
ncbi:unnamed protein product, partial [Sphacelaria rigidula]